MMRSLAVVTVIATLVLRVEHARACSPPPPAPNVAIPRPGAVAVPTLVDIVVIGGEDGTVMVDGGTKSVTLKAWGVGRGYDDVTKTAGTFSRYRPTTELEPSTKYSVKLTTTTGTRELTSFTTATGYSKPTGTAPKVKGATYTRVRYATSDIGAGACIFSEYHGFLTVDWELGAFPDTPPDSVVHVISVGPQYGGPGASMHWVGTTPYPGLAATGDKPIPLGYIEPYFDPTRVYCTAVSAWPYGQASLPLTSTPTCGSVVQRSAAGAPPSPVITDGDAGGMTDAGMTDAGSTDAAATDAASASPDCGPTAAAAPSAESAGCSYGGTGTGSALAACVALAAGSIRSRRRKHQDRP